MEVTSDYRRHKSVEHKRDKISEKHRTDHVKSNGGIRDSKTKEDHKQKPTKPERESKSKEARKIVAEVSSRAEEVVKARRDDQKHMGESSKTKKSEKESKEDLNSPRYTKFASKSPKKSRSEPLEEATSSKEEQIENQDNYKSKTDHEVAGKSSDKPKSASGKPVLRRSSGSEKKLVKSMAICDEADGDVKVKKTKDKSKLKSKDSKSSLLSNNDVFSNGTVINRSSKIKPPNILVYADSLVAKENVKLALISMLNQDK